MGESMNLPPDEECPYIGWAVAIGYTCQYCGNIWARCIPANSPNPVSWTYAHHTCRNCVTTRNLTPGRESGILYEPRHRVAYGLVPPKGILSNDLLMLIGF